MKEEEVTFRMPLPPELMDNEGTMRRVSLEEAEKLILARIEKEGDSLGCLWEAVNFYSIAGKPELAGAYMERVERLDVGKEGEAAFYVSAGQLNETLQRFDRAVECYRKAVSRHPDDVDVAYLAHNNLAYCLNLEGQHVEAEALCRTAIWINPDLHNAYKNLGLSLAGQGRVVEAARCFLLATRANAANFQALKHLQDLRKSHPEIRDGIPDIDERISECESATRTAFGIRDALLNRIGTGKTGH